MIDVKVVTLEGCPHCAVVRKVLNDLKKEYSTLKVQEFEASTPEARKYIKQYNITGAPGIIINDEFFKQGETTAQEFREKFNSLK